MTDKCPMCGWNRPHEHTPAEVTIYNNGVKYGRSFAAAPALPEQPQGEPQQWPERGDDCSPAVCRSMAFFWTRLAERKEREAPAAGGDAPATAQPHPDVVTEMAWLGFKPKDSSSIRAAGDHAAVPAVSASVDLRNRAAALVMMLAADGEYAAAQIIRELLNEAKP